MDRQVYKTTWGSFLCIGVGAVSYTHLGSVLIENNPEDRKRDTGGPGIEVAGGSLTLKGRETVIKTTDADGTVGGAAVSVTERDKDNILNFEADKTILTGGAFGIYVDGSLVNPADTIKTNINFSGETQITAYNNCLLYTSRCV